MSLTLKSATPLVLKNAASTCLFSFKTFARILHLTLIVGPRLMFTRRMSVKSASMMIMLCVPALLLCTMMTLPAFLFPYPEQHAYFQFCQVLNHDPSRWIGLMLAGTCAIIALAVPAATPDSCTSVRY